MRIGNRINQHITPPWIKRYGVLIGLALAALAAASGYLLSSQLTHGIGFPLDDAWIHQTYARSLALHGEWAFIPGQPSAGSTAPLWSALLSLGYLLRVNPLAWSYGLGILSLIGLAWVGEGWFRALVTDDASPSARLSGSGLLPWAGVFLVGEWHMVWAAVSGMETLLAALLVVWVLWLIGRARGRAWGGVGLLIGLSIWVRPDGITLLGPAILALLFVEGSLRKRIRSLAWLAGGVALFFGPYLIFNLLVQGSLWPNTFYAKQAEYAAQRQIPLLVRFFNEISLPLIGGGLFLLPGIVAILWRAWRDKNWPVLGALIWFGGYGLLYALRLPVTYQYGRYFMPAMPVFFVLGLAGTFDLLRMVGAGRPPARRVAWVLTRVGLLSMGGIWLVFYALGATRYGQDVAFIDTEMVVSARWVAANTPPNALIAAHDIGAMGYFGERRLVDLAGLISPEVIPFIRDEERLARWLDEQQVDYLVVLPGWYERLPDGKAMVYKTDGRYAPQAGGSNMSIYRWR